MKDIIEDIFFGYANNPARMQKYLGDDLIEKIKYKPNKINFLNELKNLILENINKNPNNKNYIIKGNISIEIIDSILESIMKENELKNNFSIILNNSDNNTANISNIRNVSIKSKIIEKENKGKNIFFIILERIIKFLKSFVPFLFILITPFVFSCNENEENDVDDGLIKTKFILKVKVVNKQEDILLGAKVTVTQLGKYTTKKTNIDGMAIFEELESGTITINIKAQGYAEYNSLEELYNPYDSIYNISVDKKYSLPILGASVKGKLYISNPYIPAKGFIIKLTYPSTIQPNVYYATVGADGAFLFSNVPDGSGLSVNVSAKDIIYIDTCSYAFKLAETSVFPKCGEIYDLGLLKAGLQAVSCIPIKTTATVRLRAYGDFDFKMPIATFYNPTTTIYDEGLPSDAVVTLDFSVEPDFAIDSKGLIPAVYTATPNTEGILVFNNLPVGYTFNIKYSLPVNVELAIGKNGSAGQKGVRLNSSEVLTKLPSGINLPTPATTLGGIIPTNQDDYKVSKVAYTQTFVLSTVPSLDKSKLADGEVRDYGLVKFE